MWSGQHREETSTVMNVKKKKKNQIFTTMFTGTQMFTVYTLYDTLKANAQMG